MRVRLIAIAVLAAIVLGGAYVGRTLVLQGSGGGWSHEAGDAWNAERALAANFDGGRPNLTFIVEAREGDVDRPEVAEAARDFIASLEARPGITDIESYWDLGRPDWLRSEDRSSAIITARLLGASGDYARRAAGVQGVVRNVDDAIEVSIGGLAVLHADIQQAQQSTVVPLVAAALVSLALVFLFFRNWVAAALVGATAALAVALTLLGLWGIGEFREMPVLSVILGAAAAWGLATAGGLAVMSRFIAERVAGVDRRNAVVATVATAGRTVALASVIAAAAGFGLWILPTALLRSTGYALGLAGITAGLSTVVGLGVMLAIVGVEVMSPERDERDDLVARPLDRVSVIVRRRPVIATLLLIVVLGPMLFVGLGVPTGEPTAFGMSQGSPSRRVAQTLATQFPADEAGSPFVVAGNVVDVAGVKTLTRAYAVSMSEIGGVVRVDSSEGSFVDGEPIEVPPLITRRFRGEDTAWFMVPVEGNPNGPAARSATQAIGQVEPPYRVLVGGAAAREAATVEAIDGRAPWFALAVILATFALIAWLLRSVSAALRATITIVLMTAAAGVVTRIGFSDGGLGSLLGFSGAGDLAAVGPPLAWALSLGIAAVSLMFGWGAVREAFDATHDGRHSPAIALGATRRTHLYATALLVIPLAPLLFEGWRTGKLIGAAAVATGLMTAIVGRFVALPAVTALSTARLWPIDVEGRSRRVYALTPAGRRCIESARKIDVEPPPTSPSIPEPAAPGAAASTGVGESDRKPVAAPRPVASTTTRPAPPPPAPGRPETAAEHRPSATGAPADSGADMPAEASRAATPGPVAGAAETELATDGPVAEDLAAKPLAPPAAPDKAPVVPVGERPEVDAGSSPPAVAPAAEVPATEAPTTEAVAAEDAPTEDVPTEDAPTEDAPTEDVPAAEAVATAQRRAAPASVPEPPAAVGATDAAHLEEAPEAEPASSVAAEDDEVEADGEEPAGVPDPGSVDVASLTASVIAALDSQVPFTTEIGQAFVANPANNLSRVMEAILRDASARGGDEVLVYGHASRDRYRWMVVDTGPQADNDPERARTLAEAQRFIRRVGGVVDCRPEGEFTVFVVEIPMAS